MTPPAAQQSAPQEARLTFTVTDDDTAAALGSGSLAVLGTPRLLAWCEAATCAALEGSLPPGGTSVGTRVALDHLAASPVGQQVEGRVGRPRDRADALLQLAARDLDRRVDLGIGGVRPAERDVFACRHRELRRVFEGGRHELP